ncbi:MAG TPA: hypothetical protein VIE65_12365 [Methylobacter sp.]|jgi:hypothetical protein
MNQDLLYDVTIVECTTRTVKLRVQAPNYDEAVRLAQYEANNGSIKGEETTEIKAKAQCMGPAKNLQQSTTTSNDKL